MFTAETVAQRSGTVVAKQTLMSSPQSILRRSVPGRVGRGVLYDSRQPEPYWDIVSTRGF